MNDYVVQSLLILFDIVLLLKQYQYDKMAILKGKIERNNKMEKYIFLVLGMVLGVAISLYVYAIKKERIFKRIKKDQDNFSTAKLDSALEKAVQQMQRQMNVVGRKLTEDEKNEIIFECLNKIQNNN